MNKAIFLDRDGTINVDFGYLYKPEQLEFLPGAIEAMQIFGRLGYQLIVITNQSGIGRGYYTPADAENFNRHLSGILKEYGIEITDCYICPHAPDENCHCRKPSPYMVQQAIEKHHIVASASYMFGDKQSDVACGTQAGVESHLITPEQDLLYWAERICKAV